MKQSIKAIPCHMIKNSKLTLDKQHQHCPKSEGTWCKYWKDKLEKTKTYNEDNRLPDVFTKELEAIFTSLSKDELLSRCLKGMNQNQNEAANGMLWSRCPKTKFWRARRVCIAVCETIGIFNTHAESSAEIMDMCGTTPGANTMKALGKHDNERIEVAANKVRAKYGEQRKQRAKQKAKADQNDYQAGAFSLSSKPDDTKSQRKRKSQKKPVKKADTPITFAMPTIEVTGVSTKKRRL